jgi:chitinase
VVGYFPLWVRNGGYTETDIDFSVVNTVAHFSVVPRADGSIEIPDWGPFPDTALISAAHNAGASVVLVVGGDHAAATTGFAGMAASPSLRRTFIDNLTSLVNTYGYDGVDLDWEFPKAADKSNLTALVRELRAALGAQRTLSIAGPYLDWDGGYDLPALVSNLDWIGAMTYGLHAASWASHSGHAAGLYSGSGVFHSNEFVVDASRRWYLSQGVTAAKLLIGLPFFGERFDGATAINKPLSNNQGGSMDYRAIADLANDGWTFYRDPLAQVPYLIRNGSPGVISYDDADSITTKCTYVADQGLGGGIIWHLGKDWANASQPLLRAASACR